SLSKADPPRPLDHGRSPASRAVAIGARLLSTGASLTASLGALDEAALGKWLDPVLGALAWHGYDKLIGHRWVGLSVTETRATIARNMLAAFPGLLDGHVAAQRSAATDAETLAKSPNFLNFLPIVQLEQGLRDRLLDVGVHLPAV